MVTPSPDRARAWRILAVSYVATNALVFGLSRAVAMRYGLHEMIGALFLVSALWSIRYDSDDTRRFGVRLGGVFPGAEGDDRSLVRTVIEGIPLAAREFVLAAVLAAIVLPVYAFFWPYFNRAPASRHFQLDANRWKEILTHLFAVALTEEMYFRGFVQAKFADAFGIKVPAPADDNESLVASLKRLFSSWKMLGPIVLASALFAATHVTVQVTLPRAAVFFPGILFGIVRVWRGGIGAAVFLHAASNVFEQWLEGR